MAEDIALEKTQKSPRASKEEIVSLLLPYEMRMLRYTYRQLALGAVEKGALRNCLIESFCVHARNLIDFLWGEAEKKEEPRAVHIAPSYVAARGMDPRMNPPYRNIHEQIVHLSYAPSVRPNEKIGGKDRKALLKLLEAEFSVFQNHLPESYRSYWRIPPRQSAAKVPD